MANPFETHLLSAFNLRSSAQSAAIFSLCLRGGLIFLPLISFPSSAQLDHGALHGAIVERKQEGIAACCQAGGLPVELVAVIIFLKAVAGEVRIYGKPLLAGDAGRSRARNMDCPPRRRASR